MKNNNFILLMGKSGAGKSAVAKELYKRYGLSSISSYTTRQPRYKNEQGHIFVSDDEFDMLEDMVGYTEFDGNRYCATAEQVDTHEIYVIDPAGVDYFTEAYCGNKNPIVVYLDVPDNVCFERVRHRSGLNEALQRYRNDRDAFKDAKAMADEIIKNDDLNSCVEEIYKIWKF